MHVAANILVVGALVFAAHAFTALFSRTRLPDVLLLTIIGIVLGPVCHLVTPDNFGAVGPVFASVTLVILLFEAGLTLDLDVLRGAIRPTMLLTVTNFVLTMGAVAIAARYLIGLNLELAATLGAIIGSTSPAVIVPLTKKLRMTDETKTVLFLESAISDVISIVVAIGLIEGYRLGHVRVGPMIGQMIASIIIAALAGGISAFAWSALLRRVRRLENSIFTTPAFVFVLFGVVELLGFSGYIAAVTFGAVLGNIETFQRGYWLGAFLPTEPITLNEPERVLLGEAVFLLKTFFFVYVGVSMQFTGAQIAEGAIGITAIIFFVRIPATWIGLDGNTPVRDAALVGVMTPKGLAAVVLASMPLQHHVAGGGLLQSITYWVVFLSIVFTSTLTFLIERTPLEKVYCWIFRTRFRNLPPGDNGNPIEPELPASAAPRLRT
jgi:cell volume regulation protein A